MSYPLDLTIAIPVKNEEKNLRGCLEAIGTGFAKNIIIIDSESTDKTPDIAREYNVELINFIWNGKFPKKRNWFLQNHPPATKWIFFLDADEYLTPDFKKELHDTLVTDDENIGYLLRYTIYFLSKKMKGGYPLKKLALFKVGAGEYEKIDEAQWSKLDMEVHEHPVLTGKIGQIRSKIDHQDFTGVSHYIYKHIEYADWEAKRYVNMMSDTRNMANWSWKQTLKYRLIGSVWIGPIFFFGSYFILGGFRDGTRGLAFAILKMSYFNQVYCKIQEQKVKSRI